jgi:cytochrome c55X
MRRGWNGGGGGRRLVVAALLIVFSRSAQSADGEDGAQAQSSAPARQHRLIQLVRHDCGSCHGLTLSGGLGPALVAQALRDKPVEYLQAMILHGRPGTAMPPWRGLLSEEDAHWIALKLKEGFPDER